MTRAVSRITLDTKRLRKIRAGLEPKAKDLLDKTAADITAEAIVRTTRIQTGTMRAGWTWETLKKGGRIIFNPVEYAIYHELGTRYMSPLPMLVPAVEKYRKPFRKIWRSLCE